MENIPALLCEMQIQGRMHQAAASLETIEELKLNFRSLAKGVCTAHGISCRFNWIADYTIIMLMSTKSREFSK